MFNFELFENENIEIISNDAILKTEDEAISVTVVITNQRLLILDSPKDLESFRVGKQILTPSFKEIIFEVPLEEIISISAGEEFDCYKLKTGESPILLT